MAACPICKKAALPRSENPAAPFCSLRCKQVDLGNWLNEQYRVPTAEVPDEDDVMQARDAPAKSNEELEN
jgi:endogenous inhibitor of DNA gyrase (YacG/DUF329 family)